MGRILTTSSVTAWQVHAHCRQQHAPALAACALLALALLQAGCSGINSTASREITLPDVSKEVQQQVQPASAREHQRILAAYGGGYSDPKLEAIVTQTVDRLVAASERPEAKYRVTILNSPAINAFALPSGQLYVTRGLLALANDQSELASVLSHEMAHVIANHAEARADQVRLAAMKSNVVSDVLSDPMSGALALAKSKIAFASFSRCSGFFRRFSSAGFVMKAVSTRIDGTSGDRSTTKFAFST